MNKISQNKGLIIAILFASIAISGSLVFFGFMLTQESDSVSEDLLAAQIQDGIEDYVKEQEAKAGGGVSAEALADNVGKVKRVSKEDHIFGNLDAPVSLIEYSDFECPFCKRFHETAKQVVEEYDGQVNWVYRHFPLNFHDPLATQEALASECANELGGNDVFWEYADLIFERTKSNGRGLEFEDLVTIASDLDLNENEFRTCLESEKYLDHVKQDTAEGRTAGVTGTPGNIVINNESSDAVFLSGAQPFYKFKLAIDPMLENE